MLDGALETRSPAPVGPYMLVIGTPKWIPRTHHPTVVRTSAPCARNRYRCMDASAQAGQGPE